MKLLYILLFLFSTNSVALPQSHKTPPQSAIRTTDVQNICTTKTSTIRDVSENTKKQVYKSAGVTYGDRLMCSQGYEVDHRISLTDGGSNDISNLQLQAFCTFGELVSNETIIEFTNGIKTSRPLTIRESKNKIPLFKGPYDARLKDKLEVQLHRDICSNKIKVDDAQKMLYNWKN